MMTNRSTTSTGTNYALSNNHSGSSKEQNGHRHRQRPRSKELEQSRESLDQLETEAELAQQARYNRHLHNHYMHQRAAPVNRANHLTQSMEDEERDDTEDNLADEEFEDDEVGRDVRKKRLLTTAEHQLGATASRSREENDEIDDFDDDDDDGEQQQHELMRCASEDHLETNVINDELKYGANHHNHQSMDSNPLESQSEWSDDDCREEATGKY